MIKPFHKLTQKEFDALPGGMTYGELAEKYPQPEWCDYANATDGAMGCWSLVSFQIHGPDDCSACELKRRRK